MHMLFNAFDITVSNILSLGLCADMSGFNVDGDAAFSKTFWMGFFFNSGVKKKKKKACICEQGLRNNEAGATCKAEML